MPPKKAGGGRKKAYQMAPVIPSGEIISNFQKKRWKIGKSFATGGFGRIYLAEEVVEGRKKGKQVVVKMEPAENGPLFQEIHVYQRIAKPEMLEAWKKQHRLNFLGIPAYLGSGRHEKSQYEYRFLVMPHLGKDLEWVRERNPKLDPADVFCLAQCILNSLEYMHSVQYVHADTKAENLLFFSPNSTDFSKMVLVDFGLAKRVADRPIYQENPKKAHDGTLIFTSLDAHRGCAPSYRGDIEILGYNILYWLAGSLPWGEDGTKPEVVAEKKGKFSKDIQKQLKSLFAPDREEFVEDMSKFFDYIYKLDYAKVPDYKLLRKFIETGSKKCGRRSSSFLKRKVEELTVESDCSEDEGIFEKSPEAPKPKKKVAKLEPVPRKTKASSTAKKTVSKSREEDAQAASSSQSRVIPGLANLKPTWRNGANGPVLIPTAVNRRKSVGASLVKKYLQQERVKGKEEEEKKEKKPMEELEGDGKKGASRRRKKKTEADSVEEETQTSPGLWGPIKKL